MKRVYSWVIWFFEQLLSIMIAILSLVVIAGVFFRYALNDALPWTDELSGHLLAWVTFLGAVTALERGKHINFDGLLTALPKRLSRVLGITADLFLFVFLAVQFYYGLQVTTQLMNQTPISFDVPLGIMYSIMPISGLLMMIILVYRLFVPRKFTTGLQAEVEEAEALVVEGTE